MVGRIDPVGTSFQSATADRSVPSTKPTTSRGLTQSRQIAASLSFTMRSPPRDPTPQSTARVVLLDTGMVFRDRSDAGRQLSELLRRHREEDPLVLGLPRGGVVVAFEVAMALGAPLDVWVARKIGAPGRPELGIGAVAEGGEVYLDYEMMRAVSATQAEVAAQVRREVAEVER